MRRVVAEQAKFAGRAPSVWAGVCGLAVVVSLYTDKKTARFYTNTRTHIHARGIVAEFAAIHVEFAAILLAANSQQHIESINHHPFELPRTISSEENNCRKIIIGSRAPCAIKKAIFFLLLGTPYTTPIIVVAQ